LAVEFVIVLLAFGFGFMVARGTAEMRAMREADAIRRDAAQAWEKVRQLQAEIADLENARLFWQSLVATANKRWVGNWSRN
jgi:hypothetical protein